MADWKDMLNGTLGSSTGTMVTVPGGKKWAMVDLWLFNRSSSAVVVELFVKGTGDANRFFRRELKAYQEWPIVFKQQLPAGTTISGKAGTGSAVNWFISALEE